MGTVRTIAGRVVMTHYFSTLYETNKYVHKGAETGWYYQLEIGPDAKMHGPHRLLENVVTAVSRTAEVTSEEKKDGRQG